MIAASWCCKCYTVNLGRRDISVAQFMYMRDSKYDSKSHIEKKPNTKFAHVVVEASRSFQ